MQKLHFELLAEIKKNATQTKSELVLDQWLPVRMPQLEKIAYENN